MDVDNDNDTQQRTKPRRLQDKYDNSPLCQDDEGRTSFSGVQVESVVQQISRQEYAVLSPTIDGAPIAVFSL